MGTTRQPFRIAFWSLLAALSLSLVISVSNPQAVRTAILAKSRPGHRKPSSQSMLVAETSAGSTPAIDRPSSQEPSRDRPSQPTEPAEDDSTAERHLTARLDSKPGKTGRALPSGPPQTPLVNRGAPARPVSSPSDPIEAAEARTPRHDLGMPILTPSRLRGTDERGGYVELPPPPDWEEELVPSANSVARRRDGWDDQPGPLLPDIQEFAEASTADSHPDEIAERLVQERLEAEIESLRQEIDRLTEAHQLGQQLDELQRQQQQLLEMHRELPIDRLLQLLDQLLIQLESVRETLPRADETRFGTPWNASGRIVGESSMPDEGRVSLSITEARLEDLLRMLSRLSGTSIVREPETVEENQAPEGQQVIDRTTALENAQGMNAAELPANSSKTSRTQPSGLVEHRLPPRGRDISTKKEVTWKQETLLVPPPSRLLTGRSTRAPADEESPHTDHRSPRLFPGLQSGPSAASSNRCASCHRQQRIR